MTKQTDMNQKTDMNDQTDKQERQDRHEEQNIQTDMKHKAIDRPAKNTEPDRQTVRAWQDRQTDRQETQDYRQTGNKDKSDRQDGYSKTDIQT